MNRKEMLDSSHKQSDKRTDHGSVRGGAFLADNRESNTPVQRKANSTGLPDNLKSGIENLSGHSMDDVKVHYHSSQPAQLNAHAYAQGNQIHIASGQEKHLPHEAWHVVQQKQGRVKPTMQMKGKVNVNDDRGLEKEADVMGAKAVHATKTTMQFHQPLSSSRSLSGSQEPVQGFWKELAVAAAVGAGVLVGGYIGAAAATAYSLSTAAAWGATAVGGLVGGAAVHQGIEAVEDRRPQIRIKKPAEAHRSPYYSEAYKELKKHFAGNRKVLFNDSKEEIWSYYNRIQFLEQVPAGLQMYLNSLHPQNVGGEDVIKDPFTRDFVNPHFYKKEIRSQNALAKKSRKVTLGFTYDKPAAKKYEAQLTGGGGTAGALTRLLNANAGVIISDSHSSPDSEALFLRYIDDLHKAGVDTVYLEHIKAEYQPIIDLWYRKSRNPAHFPPEVLHAAHNTDAYHNLDREKDGHNILNVVKAAVARGIRVVGIDNLAAAKKPEESSSMRTIKMNVLANEIIRKDRKKRTGKYIAIVGKAHSTLAVNNDPATSSVATLPGMSEMLSIPAVKYNKNTDTVIIDTERYVGT